MKMWRRQVGWTVPERGCKVIAAMTIWWPDRRIHDPGNLIKELADAIKGILIVDDQWLLPRIMDCGLDRQHPRVEVTLSCMGTAESETVQETQGGTR
jgi:Holliday junction resolvase RusA-like endonuclease